MNKKLISIIIPTYNRAKFIRETIESVLNQSYQNYEIIIIDDGSTDATKEVIKSYNDKRIKYIYQEHCGLPAIVRNKGLKLAIGEYVAFLDSDDLWFPQKLQKQIETLETYPKILLVSSNGFIYSSKLRIKFLSLHKDKEISFKELMQRNIIINSSVLMRRFVIKEVGLLDESYHLRSGQDYDYWLRILKYKDHSILILQDRLVKYRDHNKDRISQYGDPDFFLKKFRKISYIFKKHRDSDQFYIDDLLMNLKYEYYISKIKLLLFQKRIKLSDFLKNKSIEIKDKLLYLIEYVFETIIASILKKRRTSNFFNYLKHLVYKLIKF